MENKLNKLFDYQRFEGNKRLEKLISEAESRYAAQLSDDDLSFVCAAGEADAGNVLNSDPKKSETLESLGGIAGKNEPGQ